MIGKSAFALTLLGAPMGALAAQDGRSREQVEAVVRCIDVAPVEDRVACYDRAATALRDGLRSGRVAVVEPERERRRERTPSRIDATVAAASVTSNGGWRLELSNGHVWRTLEDQPAPPPPRGTPVRIRRTIIGSTWLSVPDRPEARIVRVE